MVQLSDSTDPVLSTESRESGHRWADLLARQVEAFTPHEISYLDDCPTWSGATTVLDVGCGDGSFMRTLGRAYPDKRFTGIDVSADLLAFARDADPEGAYRHADFSGFDSAHRFDVILLRFVVQHLTDFGAVLASCERLLAPGGAVLIIESDLGASTTTVALPTVLGALTDFEARREQDQRLKIAVKDPRALLRNHPQWDVTFSDQINVPLAGPVASDLCEKWLDVIRESDLVRWSADDALAELADLRAGGAINAVLRATCIHRTGDAPSRGAN